MVKTASQQQMKHTNTTIVLSLIQTYSAVSRAAIAKLTGLSPTTISSIVEDLLSKGLIMQTTRAESSGVGRKAITLELNGAGKYVIGMEVDAEGVTGVAYSLRQQPVVEVVQSYGVNASLRTAEHVIHTIVAVVSQLQQQLPAEYNEWEGLCVGVAGVLDRTKQHVVISAPMHLNNIALHESLVERFEVPIFVENVTLLAAMAEKEQLSPEIDSFVYLSINDGLGASVLLGNRFLEGNNKVSLEIGHMSLDASGEPCYCGNRGCLEQFVSIPSLIRRIEKLVHASKSGESVGSIAQSFIAQKMAEGQKVGNMQQQRLNEAMILEAANSGDAIAQQAIRDIGEALGNGLVNVVNIFNPALIIIGGRLSKLGEYLLPVVQERVNERALAPFCEQLDIRLAASKGSGIPEGAALFAWQHVLDQLLLAE